MQRATQSFNLTRYLVQEIHGESFDWNKPALEFYTDPEQPPRVISYTNLTYAINQLACQLQKQISEPGARILIALPHSMEYAVSFLAIIAAGKVAVPASPQLTEDEISFLMTDSHAALLLNQEWLQTHNFNIPEGRSEHTGPAHMNQPVDFCYADTSAEDPAYLVYTSGTSGQPRGVLHAQRAIRGRIPMQTGWTGLKATDRLLHAGQLNWTYSMGVGVLDCLAAGATGLFYQARSTPEVWPRLWQVARVSIFAAVPSLYRRILKYNRLSEFNLESLRYGLTAGEALEPGLLESWRKNTGLELYEALGMSEISTYISSGPLTPIRPGSPGRAQPGRKVCVLQEVDAQEHTESTESTEKIKAASILQSAGNSNWPLIVPAGEPGLLAIAADDPGMMLGYWNASTAQIERPGYNYRGKWFVGGDRVRIDADGYVTYLGRADDVMNLQGYRVAPLEVEQTLLHCELVHDAGVRSVEVKAGVHIIVAYIIMQNNQHEENETRQAIREYACKHLAEYKRPREFVFVESLPRTASGKLKRNQLPDKIN